MNTWPLSKHWHLTMKLNASSSLNPPFFWFSPTVLLASLKLPKKKKTKASIENKKKKKRNWYYCLHHWISTQYLRIQWKTLNHIQVGQVLSISFSSFISTLHFKYFDWCCTIFFILKRLEPWPLAIVTRVCGGINIAP